MGNLEFFTGFEGCGSDADVQSLLGGLDDAALIKYSATGGFGGGKCLARTLSSYFYRRTTPANTKVTGFHLENASYYGTYDWKYVLLTFAGPEIRIANYSPTSLRVYRSSTMIGEGTIIIPSTQCHVEVKVFSHATAGTVEVKVDGVSILSLTGVNTGGQLINTVFYAGYISGAYMYYDNIFIADDWVGQLKCFLRSPTSDDTVTSITPSAGTDCYAMVDELAHDGDTTYVTGTGIGTKVLFGYEALPAGVDVKAVSIVSVARREEVNPVSIKAIAKQDTTEYEVGVWGNPDIAYPAAAAEGFLVTLPTAPDGTAWARDKVNALKIGVST